MVIRKSIKGVLSNLFNLINCDPDCSLNSPKFDVITRPRSRQPRRKPRLNYSVSGLHSLEVILLAYIANLTKVKPVLTQIIAQRIGNNYPER